MNISKIKLGILLLIICSCHSKTQEEKKSEWKEEIRKTEHEFADLLKEKGLHDAFISYADEDATIMRNDKLIIGKNAIHDYYKNTTTTNLSWSPDFIEVSKSGDLGYTYGTYHFTHKDSIGNDLIDTGIFHTVWKRKQNGKWKFVWD